MVPGMELHQVGVKPVGLSVPLGSQLAAVPDQHPEVLDLPIRSDRREVGLAERDPGDEERVDGSDLAFVLCRLRAWAVSCGGTSTTSTPASCRARATFRP